MHIDVASEAARELIMDHLLMRFAMTAGALRYKTVLILVASNTGNVLMLAGTMLPNIEYLAMAGAACC